MAQNQQKYNTEYKVQAIKLSKEIGSIKAAAELGIPVNILYGWKKAVREGRLDIGPGAHTPQTAMSLAEELAALRKQEKSRIKKSGVLRRKMNFWRRPVPFSPPAVGKSARTRECFSLP